MIYSISKFNSINLIYVKLIELINISQFVYFYIDYCLIYYTERFNYRFKKFLT
jgi:hypothetical protein